jgi:hypothetical protein
VIFLIRKINFLQAWISYAADPSSKLVARLWPDERAPASDSQLPEAGLLPQGRAQDIAHALLLILV